MVISFNHTIVHASDRATEAAFFTEIFGLPAATPLGHFLVAPIAHDASIDFVQASDEIGGQHLRIPGRRG